MITETHESYTCNGPMLAFCRATFDPSRPLGVDPLCPDMPANEVILTDYITQLTDTEGYDDAPYALHYASYNGGQVGLLFVGDDECVCWAGEPWLEKATAVGCRAFAAADFQTVKPIIEKGLKKMQLWGRSDTAKTLQAHLDFINQNIK